MSPLAAGLVNMELNRGDGSLGTFLGVQAGLAMQSIAMLGSEEQKQRWLPAMARWRRSARSRSPNRCTARTRSRWRPPPAATATPGCINGQKKWIGNGTIADVVVVWARDDADGKVKGFLVEKGSPGYDAQRIDGKGSLRAVWQAEITLTDVRVPEANRLPGAQSFKDAGAVLAGTRNTVAWAALGHATAAYDDRRRLLRSSGRSSANRWSASRSSRNGWSRCSPRSARMQLYCLQLGRLHEEGRLTDTIARWRR